MVKAKSLNLQFFHVTLIYTDIHTLSITSIRYVQVCGVPLDFVCISIMHESIP